MTLIIDNIKQQEIKTSSKKPIHTEFERFVSPATENGIFQPQEMTETGEALKELNDDTIKNKMSSMDMRTRLSAVEVSSILAIDGLVRLNFLPENVLNITHQKKRLSVSLQGQGRKEIVDIVQGKQERDNSSVKGIGRLFQKQE